MLRSVIPELKQLLGCKRECWMIGEKVGRTRSLLHTYISCFLPPSKLNLGHFTSDFSIWEYLFFLIFPFLTGSSSGIWLSCFIHSLTLPSSCFLLSLVFSSKVPDLQLLTPQPRSLLTAVGCRFLSLMGNGGSSGLPFKKRGFSPHS